MNTPTLFTRYRIVVHLLIVVLVAGAVWPQKPDVAIAEERGRAMVLVEQNRYLDAYPLLDKIARVLSDDVEVWTHYGIAIGARSVTFKDPIERKAERKRSYEALSRAKQLGTQNVTALNLLDQLDPDGGDEDNFSSRNPQVEEALREGETYFGRAEYQKAFAAYERAYKLDPKSYEAALFLGDTFYAQGKYAESEPWFAKAVAIDPDKELAYRFWGDALLSQGKLKEAREKFIQALIAEPYSRHSWENINKLTQKYNKQFSIKTVTPPGTNDLFEAIKIDASMLNKSDGTSHWRKYTETKEIWQREGFSRDNPGSPYRHSLKEEADALRAVAKSSSAALKAGEIKKPHYSIANLIELHEKGLIEPYVLFLISSEGIANDYDDFRKANRTKLYKFLNEHVFVF